MDFNHPADFHFFKLTTHYLIQKGYEVKITARDKDCLLSLLKNMKMPFSSRGKGCNSKTGKYIYAIYNFSFIMFQMLKFRPSLTVCLSSPYLILCSKLLNIPCITWDDTDYNPRLLPIIKKADYILSPLNYPFVFHENHFHLNTFKELAYLHPKYYPLAGDVKREGVFFRIAGMESIHHDKHAPINLKYVINKMNRLSEITSVYFSSENGINTDFNKKILSTDEIHIHDDLNSCCVLWGNSATMAAEASVLGIPSIYVGPQKLAYLEQLENYGLLYYFHPKDISKSFQKLKNLINNPNQAYYMDIRKKMLSETIDITKLMTTVLQNFPQYISKIKHVSR